MGKRYFTTPEVNERIIGEYHRDIAERITRLEEDNREAERKYFALVARIERLERNGGVLNGAL